MDAQARVDAAWNRVRLSNMIFEALTPLDTEGKLEVLLGLVARVAPNESPKPRAQPTVADVVATMEEPAQEAFPPPLKKDRKTYKRRAADTEVIPVKEPKPRKRKRATPKKNVQMRVYAAVMNGCTTRAEVMKKTGIANPAVATNALTALRDSGLIALHGTKRGAKWAAVNNATK
jgi:hypothetical protein